MVLEELAAQRSLNHEKAHKQGVSALRDLQRAAPWIKPVRLSAFDGEAARNHWREQYQRLFEVIDTSPEVARQALVREANRHKPAKGPDAKVKGGARDAATWLSVVDYLKAHPAEKVFFVSSNTKDFGDGSTYPPPMDEDIRGMEWRLTHLTSFDDVVSTFSKPLEIDEENIENVLTRLLTTEEALTPLEAAANDLLGPRMITWAADEAADVMVLRLDGYAPANFIGWAATPKPVLRRVRDASGHQIGEEEWYTATVDWILVGFAASRHGHTLADGANFGPTACQWTVKMLFSSRQGEVPTILQYGRPQDLDPAEKDEWEPLVRKAAADAAVNYVQLATKFLVTGKPDGITIGDTAAG
jgi:hypothetical protein